MSSSRNTPTPSALNEDRPLTQADLNEYHQLFDEARSHRPESPTLPPSPPASTGPSPPSSSTSSRKRQRDENSSMEIDSVSSKRPRHLQYHVPPRIRRGRVENPTVVAAEHHRIGRDLKRQGDSERLKTAKDPAEQQKAFLIGAHVYAKGILNFAFGYCQRADSDWLGLRTLVEVAFDRFNKVYLKTQETKLEIWLAYLQYLKLALEIQHDRQRINKFSRELTGFIKQAEQTDSNLTTTPTQGGVSSSVMTKSPANPNLEVVANASQPSTPAATESKKDHHSAPAYTWDMIHSKELLRLLLHTVTGPYTGESRRKILRLLNPATLRAHFPRTFMRAFGEHGVGHLSVSADDSPSSRGHESFQPLEIWEDYEIHDLELNEKEGGDFPYPHHPENVVWVVVLGRSMLADLDLPETL